MLSRDIKRGLKKVKAEVWKNTEMSISNTVDRKARIGHKISSKRKAKTEKTWRKVYASFIARVASAEKQKIESLAK